MVRFGGWLFRHRTLIPVPLALLILLVPAGSSTAAPGTAWTAEITGGALLIALGEGLRLWGVHHIGAVSRTRTDRLGPLIASGPFAFVRNPLYLGNLALWIGFAVCARLAWLAPLILVVLGFEYHAIVRWEEGLLKTRLGDPYRAYMASVPRWIPRIRINHEGHKGHGGSDSSVFSWRDTLYSERGTLIGIGVGVVLIWIKLKS